MIEIVINYDKEKDLYKIYEPKSDTILVTSTLSESLLKLNEFLINEGMITGDLLSAENISYHFDSLTMAAMIKSNVSLLKRLSTAQSGFTSSAQKFGISNNSSNNLSQLNSKKWKNFGGAFKKSYKKFGTSSKS